MNTRFLKILFITVISQSCFGQALFKDVIGPSPNSAAFDKYGSNPVSAYTGIPNVSIPVYTISSKDLKVPISISYHAGGIRVAEEASRIGLGWLLNEGGVINRTINGGDDFTPTYGYLNNNFPEYINGQVAHILSVTSMNYCQYSANTDFCHRYVLGTGRDLSGYIPNNSVPENFWMDITPDVFSYNIPGYSGKFVIKKNRTVVKEKPDAAEIKLINSNGTSWQITTPDGVKYIFDKIENCTYSLGRTSITSWHLTKILSPLGAVINLFYSSYLTTITQYTSLSEKYTLATNTAQGTYGLCKPGSLAKSSGPIKDYDAIFLDSIVFDQGKVQFQYQDRVDLKGDKKLSSIVLKDKSNNCIKSFDFVQDYFTANAGGNTIGDPILNIDQNYFNKRLKLSGYLEKDAKDLVIKKYGFSYDERALPSKKSFAADHWGYFNGAIANNTLLPKNQYTNSVGDSPNLLVSYAEGANRDVDTSKSQAFILTQIQYPTGGKTSFVYEQNEFDMSNSINSFSQTLPMTLAMFNNNYFTRRGVNDNFTFTVPAEIAGDKYCQIKLTSENGQALTWPYPDYTDASIDIFNIADTIHPVYHALLGSLSFWTDLGIYKYKREDQALLPPGTYIVKTHINSNVTFLNYVTLNLSFPFIQHIATNHQTYYGGGVRIAKMIDNSLATGKNVVKKYIYNYADSGQSRSYGRLLSFVEYASKDFTYQCERVVNESNISATCINLNINSTSQMVSNSPTVGYDRVIELEGENGENGKTVYAYVNEPDLPLTYNYTFNSQGYSQMRPPGVPNLINLNNGNLVKKTVYSFDIQSSSFKKIQETRNDYISDTMTTALGLRIMPGSPCYNNECTSLLAQYPAFQSQLTRLSSETFTTYSSATDSILTKKNYFYEPSPVHYQPTKTTMIKSDGVEQQDYTLYASDYQSGTGFIDSMKMKRLLAMPIETATALKSASGSISVTRGQINTFKTANAALLESMYVLEVATPLAQSVFKFSNNTLGQLPLTGSAGKAFQMDARYQKRISFDAYDVSNNLVEQTKVNDIKKSYIWDYNLSYPVAEITNAASSSIAYTSFEGDGNGNWTIPSTARNNYGITGTKSYSLTSGSITKTGLTNGIGYIVSYWSKGGPANVNNATGTLIQTHLGWNQYKHVITSVTGSAITVSGSVVVDELKCYPAGAQMSTYTYKPLIGTVAINNANDKINYYEYDDFGRLKAVRDNDSNITKMICYNYYGQPENCLKTFYSIAKSQSFTPACSIGGITSPVLYSVPASAYQSYISQSHADSLAQADVTSNGPAYANTNGVCNYSSAAKTGSFTRNNCGADGTTTAISYTLPAGAYTSTISKSDADTKAAVNLNSLGQAYANTNGVCRYSSSSLSGSFNRNNCSVGGATTPVVYALAAGAYTSAISKADADAKAAVNFNSLGQAYANANGVCTFSSAAATGSFSRNNCDAGGTTSALSYTIPAGAYMSTVSKADADAKAATNLNNLGQAYANANGVCTYASAAITGSFSRNNCSEGATTIPVAYTLPAGAYSSTASKADADATASANFNNLGQAYANVNGVCTYASSAISGNFSRNNCGEGYTTSFISYTLWGGAYTSTISKQTADASASSNFNRLGQEYANANGVCTCAPYFTWAAGLTSIANYLSFSGTTVTFTFATSTYPAIGGTIVLGNLVGSCVYPNAARTIPVFVNGTNFNLIVNTNGQVLVQYVSGATPSGSIGFHGTYDTQVNTFYSNARTGSYNRNNCPTGQVGSAVSYSVPAYLYTSTVSQQDADQQAQNVCNTQGQNNANSNGTCNIACGFTWASGVYGYMSSCSSSGTTVSFSLSFASPTANYSGGTIGTITGGCIPTGYRYLTMNDGAASGRSWRITITSAGVVSISLNSGSTSASSNTPISLSNGSFTK